MGLVTATSLYNERDNYDWDQTDPKFDPKNPTEMPYYETNGFRITANPKVYAE